LPTVPERKPRRECACQPVVFISSFRVAPLGRLSRSRTLAVLLPSRTPSALAGWAVLGAWAAFLGLAVAAGLGLPPLPLFWPLGALFFVRAAFFEEALCGATEAPGPATAVSAVAVSVFEVVIFVRSPSAAITAVRTSITPKVFEKQEDSVMAKDWRWSRRRCHKMSGNVTELKPKQEEAIMALLSSRTVEDAARVVKITPRTLYRWLNEPCFAAAYRQARRTAFAQCTARLQQASGAAASVLLRVMTDAATPAAVKVRSADSVLHHAEKASEIEDIEARVAELEQAVARESRKSSAVVEWASTKALPGRAATTAQISPAVRLLAAPREAERNDDTDQSQAHERVASMSDTEWELRPISPKAQKATPKGPNGG